MKLAVLLAALAACDLAERVYVPEVHQDHVTLVDFAVQAPAKADVLFVVDRSPALDPYLESLHEQVALVGRTLQRSRYLDLHLGVVGAAADDGPGTFIAERTNPHGERVAFTGDLGDTLATLALPGARGPGETHLFDAATRAIHHDLGFRRDDGGLIVVFLAAADDNSTIAATDLTADLATVAPQHTAFAVIVTPGAGPRLAGLAAAMPNRAVTWSMEQQLSELTQLLPRPSRFAGDPCIENPIDPATCQFSDVAAGNEWPLAACGDALPCWQLVFDDGNCPDAEHLRVDIDRIDYPPKGTHVLGQCVGR